MKLETFFEKFEQFAEAPNAVAKMRELVLQLAVQGKLVPQELGDEPAEALLRRIDSEREQLVRAKQVRRQDALGPIADDETPFPIPGSWQWRRLADVCFVITDGAHHTPNYLETGVPFLSVKDVSGGEIDFSSTRFISEEAHRELCKRCRPEPGDILLTKVGTTGIAVTVDDSREFSLFVSLALLKFSHKNLDSRYLKYLINSSFVRKQSADNTQGIGNKNLVLRLINQFSVPIPPLAEQKRIVAKVDELMALCDRLETQQQERDTRHAALARASLARFADAPTPANLNLLFHPSYAIAPADLRKTILTLAVQGKIVPQDASDESADDLLVRVKRAKEQLIEGRRIRQSDDVEYSDPEQTFSTPQGWTWIYVSDVAVVQGGKRLPNGATFSDDPTPYFYIRVTDMKNSSISETGLRYISPSVQREIARYTINKEDIYITIAGTIGDVGIVPDALDGHNLTENAAKIVFRGIDRRFFQLALASEFVQAQFLEKTKQMAQPKLALKRICGAKFCMPPLAEQRRIVAKVDQLMALVDQLETQLTASRNAAINLMEAAVAELTVQG
jgi:type I restriction enzyme S subunit